ncbi:MAG TPA: phosphoribosylformylglycinamidine synthase subunit PurL [Bryobacteraceae bacterium]|jgi:phosphoribosylformylglycinamidine synthase|nr:phosphoribosylformylglycinamidine synthase subunit PurL [Bryobacteraceae bacterium]
MTITPELIEQHQLTPTEYQKIVSLLGREPSYTELGVFSVMWSEHCSYKSSRIHLKKLPTTGKYVVQGPGENAGIIGIGDGWVVAFKIESHNHPSYIEPFQGAATGVGGILRDIFTMGARPIAVMDSLRFGPPVDSPRADRNRRILTGVVSGIAHYGNCFGVPTVGGECVFEECYSANPLVNVFALGVCKQDEIFYARASGIGNPVIYVGAKTGRDGIHGASMASAEFTEESKQKRPNVQVGDPFLEKLLLEACIEAMKTGAIVAIQDMGAAGLTSSSCEMGSRGGVGIDIDLDKVPQRESGMTAYEMLLSESQERMLLVAEKGREGEVFQVFRKWGLDAVTIGVVTADGLLRIRHHGALMAEIPNAALADEAPRYDRPHNVKSHRRAPMDPPAHIPASETLNGDLLKLVSSPDLCSKRLIWEQYDYMVRTNTLVGPGSDAAVVRVKETGTSIAMSLDGNGRYCYLDPREGAKLAVAECCRNLATTGAVPVAATNNLNFGNPERPEIMAQLVEAIEGIAEACAFFEAPITGGNVSLYNETLGEGIYPTPVLGIIGLMKTALPAPVAFQSEGADVLLLGGLGEHSAVGFGSSEYAKVVLNQLWGLPPRLDMTYEKRVHDCVREILAQGLAESAHDLSDGGLAVALSECCTRQLGALITLNSGERAEFALYGEAPSRILVTTRQPERIHELALRFDVDCPRVGVTMKERLQIGCGSTTWIDMTIADLKRSFETALPEVLHTHAG